MQTILAFKLCLTTYVLCRSGKKKKAERVTRINAMVEKAKRTLNKTQESILKCSCPRFVWQCLFVTVNHVLSAWTLVAYCLECDGKSSVSFTNSVSQSNCKIYARSMVSTSVQDKVCPPKLPFNNEHGIFFSLGVLVRRPARWYCAVPDWDSVVRE
jgi:hypothetical protein